MPMLGDHLFATKLAVILTLLFCQSKGLQYIVGDSFWSIPTTNDFYNNWSSSHFFHTGDTLYFDFDTGLHNVMQVSRREYGSCSSDHPFKIFEDGPATVVLGEEGVFYFICSVANYCSLGQKLSVVVHLHNNSPNSAPILSPSPPKPNSVQTSALEASQKGSLPPVSTPNSSQAPNTLMMDLPVSLVGVKSGAGDLCCNGDPVCWFAAICFVLYFIIIMW